MATISGLTGKQYTHESKDYAEVSYQYATSSHPERTKPALVVQPSGIEDIKGTIKYAKTNNIAIAIKSGGHQYSGASSTIGPNIQLDLGTTFQADDDRNLFQGKDGKSWYVRTSVSWALGDFNAWLGKQGCFVPHGQCTHVHVGGHVQTGGYGQLGRSFGLFGDQVVSLEIIDHEANSREVTKTSDPDLFYAILGGSPGNFGVITHLTIQVYRNEDHKGSRGLKAVYWYSPETLKYLVDIMTEMADNDDFPRNYDYCVSVLSSSFKVGDLFDSDIDEKMKNDYPQYFGKDGICYWPRTIVVYAQWVPFSATDKCDMSWFTRINKLSIWWLDFKVEEKNMSDLTAEWIFQNVREFDHPYEKRTYVTDSKTLGKDGWAAWVTNRIDAIVRPDDNGCYLSCQIQCFGGKNSKFASNAGNGTSYSWRDTSICCTIDAFYDGDKAQDFAEQWQKKNDDEGLGPNGKFCKQDRRVLWGSYGDYDLDKVWRCYHEDEAKYERLRKARQLADPNGTFTPNTFSVKR